MSEQTPRDDAKGIIGRSFENGARVVWRFVNELPGDAVRVAMPWMIVLGWRYDGAGNDGMPDQDTQAAIHRLDERLQGLDDGRVSHLAYCRTGNGLREWVFYAPTHQAFMAALNVALANDERYPIAIKFYEDPDWTEFRELLHDFGQTRMDRMN